MPTSAVLEAIHPYKKDIQPCIGCRLRAIKRMHQDEGLAAFHICVCSLRDWLHKQRLIFLSSP